MNDPLSLNDFLSLTQDEDGTIRCIATGILPKFKDSKSINPLILALEDNNPCVRVAAVVALKKINGTNSIEPLLNELQREIKTIKTSKVNNKDLLSIAEVAGSLEIIIETLGEMGDQKAVEPLGQILKSENIHFAYYDIFEVEQGGIYEGNPITGYRPKNPFSRTKQFNPYPIEVAYGGHRIASAKALSKIGGNRAFSYLTQASNDGNPEIRDAVKNALNNANMEK
ncbi:MAG: HEAT repeat domain-containing protein [Nitrospirae bacterium]|nr:HEAT repeat domain-containing protein [Nitrospirota bacterium]